MAFAWTLNGIKSFKFGSGDFNSGFSNPLKTKSTALEYSHLQFTSMYFFFFFFPWIDQSLTSDEESVFNYGEDATYPLSSK